MLREIRQFLAALLLAYGATSPAPETTDGSMEDFELDLHYQNVEGVSSDPPDGLGMVWKALYIVK